MTDLGVLKQMAAVLAVTAAAWAAGTTAHAIDCPAGMPYTPGDQTVPLSYPAEQPGGAFAGCFDTVNLIVDGAIETSSGPAIHIYGNGVMVTITDGASVVANGSDGIALVVGGPSGASAQIKVGGKLVGGSGTAILAGDENDSLIRGPDANITGGVNLGGGENTDVTEMNPFTR